jgi:plasmid stabilization system protein ParE
VGCRAFSNNALADLSRLYGFLATRNEQAAARTVRSLAAAPTRLLQTPRIGERLSALDPREVRRVLIGDYEVRYEIRRSRIYVLRLWHTRENR